MEFTIEETTDRILVSVKLPKLKKDPLTGKTTNRVKVRKQHVLKYLNDNNIKVGKLVKPAPNDNLDRPYITVWEFEKYLDKEKIILDKNGVTEVQYKPKRKRRTKKILKKD